MVPSRYGTDTQATGPEDTTADVAGFAITNRERKYGR